MKIKSFAKRLLKHTPFYPVHMGGYIRGLYLWRQVARLPVHQWERALDAGCGLGYYTREFAYRYPNIEVVGYDLKAHFLAEEERPSNLYLQQRDLLALEEKVRYDFIYCIDVLEHIPGNLRAITNLYQALKPGGYFYMHIPRIMPGKRIFPQRWFSAFDEWACKEHVGEQYTLEEASELLREIGFTIIQSKLTFGFPGELAWELDRLTDNSVLMKITLAPFEKALAFLAVRLPASRQRGNVLVVGQKANG